MTFLAQIPTAEDLESFTNADDLTAWDFVWAGLAIVIALLLARLARHLLRPALQRMPQLADEAAALIARATGWIIIFIGALYAVGLLGIDMGPALIVILVVAIVVFFAGRRMMENFSAGLVLQGTPMFNAEDQIVTDTGTGTVREITGRTVVIETVDGELVHIPNRIVIEGPIVNLTRLGSRRSVLDVGVAYGTNLTEARDTLEQAAADCPTTRPDPPPQALVAQFGDNAVEYRLYFWHEPEILEGLEAIDAVARSVERHFADRGIVIAFPQRTLWWGDDTGRSEAAQR